MDTTFDTGATGLIGSNILQALLQRGHKVKVLVRSIERGKALLPESCELVQGDITDPAAVRRAMEGCSVVYHTAGYHEQWLPDPAEFQRVNVGGTQNMLEAALAEEQAEIGSRYILSEGYYSLNIPPQKDRILQFLNLTLPNFPIQLILQVVTQNCFMIGGSRGN